MTLIDDILGPIAGDLGLPSMSDMIHDVELLLMISIGFMISLKILEYTLESAL